MIVVFVLEYVSEHWGVVAHITVVSSQNVSRHGTDPIIVLAIFFPSSIFNCFLIFQKRPETKTQTPNSLYVWLEHFYWEGASYYHKLVSSPITVACLFKHYKMKTMLCRRRKKVHDYPSCC